MKNLKQYNLEKLDNLPHNAGIHQHYDSTFGSMKSMWDGKRDWHGSDWIKKTRKIIKGSSGRSISHVVERIKAELPKRYYQTPFDFVYCSIDYTQSSDGLLYLKQQIWRGSQVTTIKDLTVEVNGWREYTIYLDKDNCIQVIYNARRYRTPKRSKKEYYESRAAKRRSMKIERTNAELIQNMTVSFLGNVDLYAAFTTLRKAWKKAQKDVSEHQAKSIDAERPDYWRSWSRHMLRQTEKKLKTLTSDMNAINSGDYSVLNVYVREIQEKRTKEQERLSNAA